MSTTSLIKTSLITTALVAALAASSFAAPASAAVSAGQKNLTATLTADNHIIADWDATTGAKYYKVRTSSTPDMSRDVKTYMVAKSSTEFSIDAMTGGYDYAAPKSGNYVFVRVYVVKTSGVVGESPYKRVRLHPIAPNGAAIPLTVATFNVRTAESEVTGHTWKSRLAAVAGRIKDSNASVVAIQEAGYHPANYATVISKSATGTNQKSRNYYWQFEQLRDAVGGSFQLTDDQEYSLGAGKEGTRILYDSSKLTMLDQGNFAPSAINKYLRFVPWALFQDNTTGEQFYFISAHLDNRKDSGTSTTLYKLRLKQIGTIIDKARSFSASGHQVVLAGDLNSNIYSAPNNGVDDRLLAAGFSDAYATTNNVNEFMTTFNQFARSKVSASRTDYILTYGRPDLGGSFFYKNWTAKSNGIYASDHNLQSAVLPY